MSSARLVAVELGAASPACWTIVDHALGRLVAEHADGEDLRRQPLDDVGGPTGGDLARDGAKMKPTASAPMATARSASSSLVIPQILTNISGERYCRGDRSPATAAAGSPR